ncbi:ROK family transcriptional regulator [Schaalia sp. Marseille-Q2122]|uniref:ROK family transcriptional regulator n=1 Tax=Schaalia sp. Marseille-Q2122 TaxID=2736604 RepID=UPI00158B3323|nr:ROK family transcriptional regulator [Schaalia sp. Marseille-Q2122]
MEESAVHADRLADLSAASRARCIAELRRASSQPLHALASAIGLSRPALKAHLDTLIGLGFVTQEEPRIGRQGGRPAATFSLNPAGATLCVLDISRHEHRYLLLDLEGTIHHATTIDADGSLSPSARSALILDQIHNFLNEAHTPIEDINYFSGAIGGQVDSSGTAQRICERNALIDNTLPANLPSPLILENDLKAAAHAEQRIGGARGLNDIIYALVWYQVAAGLILDGKLRRGVHELAGELNLVHSTSDLPTERLTQWESWPAVLDLAHQCDNGNEAARTSIRDFCQRAAQQIAFLASSTDPEMIVLGGPLVHRSTVIVNEVINALRKELPNGPAFATTVSALPTWGPALGAALRGLETFELRTLGAASQEYHLHNATPLSIPIPPLSERSTTDCTPSR